MRVRGSPNDVVLAVQTDPTLLRCALASRNKKKSELVAQKCNLVQTDTTL